MLLFSNYYYEIHLFRTVIIVLEKTCNPISLQNFFYKSSFIKEERLNVIQNP